MSGHANNVKALEDANDNSGLQDALKIVDVYNLAIPDPNYSYANDLIIISIDSSGVDYIKSDRLTNELAELKSYRASRDNLINIMAAHSDWLNEKVAEKYDIEKYKDILKKARIKATETFNALKATVRYPNVYPDVKFYEIYAKELAMKYVDDDEGSYNAINTYIKSAIAQLRERHIGAEADYYINNYIDRIGQHEFLRYKYFSNTYPIYERTADKIRKLYRDLLNDLRENEVRVETNAYKIFVPESIYSPMKHHFKEENLVDYTAVLKRLEI